MKFGPGMTLLLFAGVLAKGESESRLSAAGRGCAPVLRLARVAAIACALYAAGIAAQITPTAPTALNTDAVTDTRQDKEPQVTTDGFGHWVAVWAYTVAPPYGDILFSRSADNGATWTAPATLSIVANQDDRSPQVATDGNGHWVAVWHTTSACCNGILASRSTDNGATWTPFSEIFSSFIAAPPVVAVQNPRITTDYFGNWVVVFEAEGSNPQTDRDIMVSRSTNNGVSWTVPAALNTDAVTDTRQDKEPQVTTDSFGHWVAVWAYTVAPPYGDILFSRSADNGATWTAPATLSIVANQDDRSPQVAADDGQWVAVWHTTSACCNGILASRSTDNGATWTPFSEIFSSFIAAPPVVAVQNPRITTDYGGNWVVVFEAEGSNPQTDRDIMVSRSTNNGATWTGAVPFNANAATDSGADSEVQLATDSAGKWIAVWKSTDTLNGTIGTDSEILRATFTLDVNSPTATTITPSTTGPTNATSVSFTVTFSENVVNFNNAADVVITHSGTANSGVTISGGPLTYTANVTGISGTGSFTLRVSTGSDVQDAAGNALLSSVTSAAVSIDNGSGTDSDGDGLSDATESSLGTSSTGLDSDGDGIFDGQEIDAGTLPNNAASFTLLSSVYVQVGYTGVQKGTTANPVDSLNRALRMVTTGGTIWFKNGGNLPEAPRLNSPVTINAMGAAPLIGANAYRSQNVPVNILDESSVNSTLTIPASRTITDVNVRIDLTHSYDGDLRIELIAPDATVVMLVNQRGSSGADFRNTLIDDEASTSIASGTAPFTASYRPDGGLFVLDGKNALGTWTLRITDVVGGDIGILNDWSLEIH